MYPYIFRFEDFDGTDNFQVLWHKDTLSTDRLKEMFSGAIEAFVLSSEGWITKGCTPKADGVFTFLVGLYGFEESPVPLTSLFYPIVDYLVSADGIDDIKPFIQVQDVGSVPYSCKEVMPQNVEILGERISDIFSDDIIDAEIVESEVIYSE